MTIQELFEWDNENDALNEPVSIPDNYDGRTLAEGAGGRRMSNELFEIFLDMLEEACYDVEQEGE